MLVAGWLAALPIPPLLIWAPDWGWVVAANVLLGVNQGLAWSTTVIMKIDLAGPARRGLAMGLNEAGGYGAVAITALVTGYLAAAYGLRPAPFLLGAAYIALGLGAALDAGNVRKMFKRVCTGAGIGDSWTPRELRTSFVSLMSHRGISIEEIARLAGHASTRTTEVVYRRELRPIITTGAEVMDELFTRT